METDLFEALFEPDVPAPAKRTHASMSATMPEAKHHRCAPAQKQPDLVEQQSPNTWIGRLHSAFCASGKPLAKLHACLIGTVFSGLGTPTLALQVLGRRTTSEPPSSSLMCSLSVSGASRVFSVYLPCCLPNAMSAIMNRFLNASMRLCGFLSLST